MNIQNVFHLLCAFITITHAFPDQGKWEFNISTGTIFPLYKSLYNGSQVFVQINCEPKLTNATIRINLVILQSKCWDVSEAFRQIKTEFTTENQVSKSPMEVYQDTEVLACSEHVLLNEAELKKGEKSFHSNEQPVYVVEHDGVYVLGVKINTSTPQYSTVRIEMQSDYGYLSAADWPLLQFYGFMCVYYVILGIFWLIMSFLQWRDLLRVQFWIGGVILLGMLEKATFYAEYQNVNSTGTPVQGAMLFAEWVSCAKRTLARMLVVIVSLGFGIVKPRLGATLHRVVGVGLLYFFLAASEGYLRVTKVKSDINGNKDLLVASVPLAVLDSAICWWIFSALVNTTRTLRLRRNETKLNLYRHFTNTLIFSVVASVFFMLYCIKTHHFVTCLTVWKDIWLEEAYWHILFSCLLLVIMILWRPTNNNQRYAFVPLLDTGDDAEEEEQLVNDAYGVKVRIHHSKPTISPRSSVDDDLKWLEENIKSDPALPILDSDEELVNTRFEVSKMQ